MIGEKSCAVFFSYFNAPRDTTTPGKMTSINGWGVFLVFLTTTIVGHAESSRSRDEPRHRADDDDADFPWLSVVIGAIVFYSVVGYLYHTTVYWYATPAEELRLRERQQQAQTPIRGPIAPVAFASSSSSPRKIDTIAALLPNHGYSDDFETTEIRLVRDE